MTNGITADYFPKLRRNQPLTDKWIWARVSPCPNTGCWWWMSAISKWGYGMATRCGKHEAAHRVIYRFFRGEFPAHLDLDHLCRQRSCVNPWHLEPVTRAINLQRGNSGKNLAALAMSKIECPKGHPYSGSNLYIARDGHRDCIACQRQRVRDWRARQMLHCEGT